MSASEIARRIRYSSVEAMVLVVLKASFMIDGVTLIYSSQLLSETDPTSVDRKEEVHERIMSPSFLPVRSPYKKFYNIKCKDSVGWKEKKTAKRLMRTKRQHHVTEHEPINQTGGRVAASVDMGGHSR